MNGSDLFLELTSGPLAAELAPFIAARNDATIDEIMHRKDIVVAGNLSVHDVKQYMSLIGLRLPILDSTAQSCREFNTALEDFKESGFDLSNALILGRITQVLDALVSETMIPDFTNDNKLIILSLGNKTVSRSDQLGGVTLSKISDALNGAG